MNDLDDFMPFIVIGGLIAAIVVFIAVMMNWECNGYQEITGKPTKLAGGNCYIKDGENWYQWGEYKYRLATKGEIK